MNTLPLPREQDVFSQDRSESSLTLLELQKLSFRGRGDEANSSFQQVGSCGIRERRSLKSFIAGCIPKFKSANRDEAVQTRSALVALTCEFAFSWPP